MRLSEKDAAALLGHKGYRRRHKFNATRVEVDGIWFDSQAEATRYGQLQMLVLAREIYDLELQPEFVLSLREGCDDCSVTETILGKYVADFRYFNARRQVTVVEDVKGFKTALYRWKKRHVEAQYGIEIVEV